MVAVVVSGVVVVDGAGVVEVKDVVSWVEVVDSGVVVVTEVVVASVVVEGSLVVVGSTVVVVETVVDVVVPSVLRNPRIEMGLLTICIHGVVSKSPCKHNDKVVHDSTFKLLIIQDSWSRVSELYLVT